MKFLLDVVPPDAVVVVGGVYRIDDAAIPFVCHGTYALGACM